MAHAAAVFPESMHVPATATTRNALRVEFGAFRKLGTADARGHTDALAEVREVEDGAENSAIEGLAAFRIGGIRALARAEHPTEIEELEIIARADGGGHRARVAEKSPPVTQGADEHVAALDDGQTPARELELVVSGFVVEDFHRHDHAFFRGDVRP